MENFPQTVVSQYTNSTTLDDFLDYINGWIDPQANLNQFYTLMFNVDTAVGYGLDVWGRIVGVQRVLQVQSSRYLGFDEQTPLSVDPFNQSPLYSGEPLTGNFSLTDQAFRLLIMAKAAANITNNSIPAVNAILMALFPGRGNAYVKDARAFPHTIWFGFAESHDAEGFNVGTFGDHGPSIPNLMHITYVFEFGLVPYEVAIVTQSGVLPKGAGVVADAQYLIAS